MKPYDRYDYFEMFNEEYNEEEIEELRKKLIDYYGSAMALNPMAVVDVAHIENALDEEIIGLARKHGYIL